MGRYGSFWFIMGHCGSFRVLVQPFFFVQWTNTAKNRHTGHTGA